jgi:hypothetical protein
LVGGGEGEGLPLMSNSIMIVFFIYKHKHYFMFVLYMKTNFIMYCLYIAVLVVFCISAYLFVSDENKKHLEMFQNFNTEITNSVAGVTPNLGAEINYGP